MCDEVFFRCASLVPRLVCGWEAWERDYRCTYNQVHIYYWYIVLLDVFMYIFDVISCHLSQVTHACTLCMDIGGD